MVALNLGFMTISVNIQSVRIEPHLKRKSISQNGMQCKVISKKKSRRNAFLNFYDHMCEETWDAAQWIRREMRQVIRKKLIFNQFVMKIETKRIKRGLKFGVKKKLFVNQNEEKMQKFEFRENDVKNQCYYTCRRCAAHLYLQADLEGEDDELRAHDVVRDDCHNIKRISLNWYAVECRCGAYLGFLHANQQTV